MPEWMPDAGSVPPVDCQRVDQEHLAEHYVLGQLVSPELEAFEDHYMLCPVCVAKVEEAELMAGGFKRMAAEDLRHKGLEAPAAAPVVELDARRPRRAPSFPWRHASQLMAAALVGVVFSWSLLQDRPEVSSAGAVYLVHLQPVRSSDQPPAHRLPNQGDIVLALELSPPFYDRYRARLEGGGDELWNGVDLVLGERDTVSVVLPRAVLVPGDHVLRLEGSNPEGESWFDAGLFTFRVKP